MFSSEVFHSLAAKKQTEKLADYIAEHFHYIVENAVYGRVGPKGKTAVMKAGENGVVPSMRKLVECGSSVEVDRMKLSTLLLACEKGQLYVVEELLELGVDVNCRDSRGTTPLILATRFGQGSIINLLLDHGAEIDAEDDYGNSALSEACFVGRAYIVQRLLSRGAHFVQDPIQLRPNSPKISVLQRAINQGFEEIVGLLLSSGLTGDVNMSYLESVLDYCGEKSADTIATVSRCLVNFCSSSSLSSYAWENPTAEETSISSPKPLTAVIVRQMMYVWLKRHMIRSNFVCVRGILQGLLPSKSTVRSVSSEQNILDTIKIGSLYFDHEQWQEIGRFVAQWYDIHRQNCQLSQNLGRRNRHITDFARAEAMFVQPGGNERVQLELSHLLVPLERLMPVDIWLELEEELNHYIHTANQLSFAEVVPGLDEAESNVDADMTVEGDNHAVYPVPTADAEIAVVSDWRDSYAIATVIWPVTPMEVIVLPVDTEISNTVDDVYDTDA